MREQALRIQRLELEVVQRDIKYLHSAFSEESILLKEKFQNLSNSISVNLTESASSSPNYGSIEIMLSDFRASSPYLDYISLNAPPGLMMDAGRGVLGHPELSEIDRLISAMSQSSPDSYPRVLTFYDDMSILIAKFIKTDEHRTGLLCARSSLLGVLARGSLGELKSFFLLNRSTGSVLFPPGKPVLKSDVIDELTERFDEGLEWSEIVVANMPSMAVMTPLDENRIIGTVADISGALVPIKQLQNALWASSLFVAICLGLVAFYLYDLMKLAGRLEKANQALVEADRIKNDFISMVSHDLRTPLARIIGLARKACSIEPSFFVKSSSLKNGSNDLNVESDNGYVSAFKEIENNARELDRFIMNLLQARKLEIGENPLDFKPGDPTEIIRDILKSMVTLSESRKIDIRLDMEEVSTIIMDERLIYCALSNILGNALKYSPSKSYIRIVVRENDDGVEITICDKGPGIAPEERERVFNRFYRSGNQSTTGMGLGLYLVARIVELHGGRVIIKENRNNADHKSNAGHGTSVIVRLPFEQ